MINHAGYTVPTRRHELDRYRSGTYLPCLADVGHELGIPCVNNLKRNMVGIPLVYCALLYSDLCHDVTGVR